MQMRQLRSYFGQPQLSGGKVVTSHATEFLKAFRPLALLRRALVLGRLDNYGHRRQHVDASLKTLSSFLARRSETKLAVVTYGVAILAAVCVEYILRELLVAFAGSDHPIQRGRRLLRRRLRQSERTRGLAALGQRRRARQTEADSCQ